MTKIMNHESQITNDPYGSRGAASSARDGGGRARHPDEGKRTSAPHAVGAETSVAGARRPPGHAALPPHEPPDDAHAGRRDPPRLRPVRTRTAPSHPIGHPR